MSNKNQASRSHPEDSLGSHSKVSQTPVPANSQTGTTSTNVHESRDVSAKTKSKPAHLTSWHNLPGEHEESLRRGAFPNRNQGEVKESAGAAARARQQMRGKLIHGDGTSDARPGKRVARIG